MFKARVWFTRITVQIWLFLHNMVTEVMHLSYQCLYLDGGKPDTSGGFNIKDCQPVVGTFDNRQLLGSDRHWIFSDQGYHFRMGWSWERLLVLQLHKPREFRTKDGSHIVPIRICGYLIKHMCKEEERWMWWKLKVTIRYLLFKLILRVLFYSWIHPFQPRSSLALVVLGSL